LKKIAIFLAGAVPPIAAWFIRNALVAESATNRSFRYHPIELKNIRFGLRNFSQFLTPFEGWQNWLFTSGALSRLLIALGVVLLVWLVYRIYHFLRGNSSAHSLVFTTGLYTFAYLAAVLFSMSFFDASTKFQHRILSPLYVSWMILLVALLAQGSDRLAGWTRNRESAFLRAIRVPMILFLAAIVLGLSIFNFQRSMSELREAGQGYASWKWRDSMVMAELKKLPPEIAIYTNTPPAVYLVTGRAGRVIPSTLDPVDNLPRRDYEQNLAQMRADLLAGQAVLALFDTSNVEDAIGVDNIADFSSGLVVLEKAQGDILYGKP